MYATVTGRVKLRLTGKRRTRFDMGGVEIEIGGKLQTICISDDKVAAVICRQLGLPSWETFLSLIKRVHVWLVGVTMVTV